MKIIIDATTIAHGSRAARRHSKNLIETLVRIDHKNSYKILYIDKSRRKHRYANLPYEHSVSEIIIPLPERLFRFAWENFAIPTGERLLSDFDVFYATGFYFPPAKRGTVLGTIRGIAHNIIEDKINPRILKKLKKNLGYTLKHADYFLAVSKKTKQELVEHMGIEESRVYVVTHGVDPKFKKSMDRESLLSRLDSKFGIRSPYILYVGDTGYHKNIIGLVNAYSISRDHGIDIPLVMAGPKGSAWDEAHKLISNKRMKKSVHMIGHVDPDNNDLTDLYNGACLFVFPSFYEGWTSPPLEAMACGTPVITSNCSSLPETVGNAAILVDPNNTESLAYEMKRVLFNKELQKELIEKGLVHVSSHTWEKAGQKMIEVFADVMTRGPWEKR